MPRVLNPITNIALGASVPASLALAVQSDQWVIGAAGATAGLCLLAFNQPRWGRRDLQARLRDLESSSHLAATSGGLQTARQRAAQNAEAGDLVGQMLAHGRMALLLRPQIAASLEPAALQSAQEALDAAMAIVPQGPVVIQPRNCEDLSAEDAQRAERLVQVDGFYLDRFPVTNWQYQQFVDAGGYEQMTLWDEAIWPAVLGFVDQTGQGGPKFWQGGTYPTGKEDHPVVGVCWYEAAAYARWVGKRLPTDPEWIKAGSWPVCAASSRPVQRKFPWGDAMDRSIVNIWGSGSEGTVSVTATPHSASVGGVQQLIGNVWEWMGNPFGAWEPARSRIDTAAPMRSIRGGAFDTYFDSQSHCQFQSGECPLARKHNIGFRCALGFGDIVQPGDDLQAGDAGDDSDVPSHEVDA